MMEVCARMEDVDQVAMMQSGEGMLEALELEFARAQDLLAAHQREAAAPPDGHAP